MRTEPTFRHGVGIKRSRAVLPLFRKPRRPSQSFGVYAPSLRRVGSEMKFAMLNRTSVSVGRTSSLSPLPAALPDAMTALKVASGTAVAVLFMAESFATRRGLGFLIMDAWGRGDQLEMFTGILAMSLLGVALYELCNVLETRSCRWRNFHMAGKR